MEVLLALADNLADDTGGGGAPHVLLIALAMVAFLGFVMVARLAFRRPR